MYKTCVGTSCAALKGTGHNNVLLCNSVEVHRAACSKFWGVTKVHPRAKNGGAIGHLGLQVKNSPRAPNVLGPALGILDHPNPIGDSPGIPGGQSAPGAEPG